MNKGDRLICINNDIGNKGHGLSGYTIGSFYTILDIIGDNKVLYINSDWIGATLIFQYYEVINIDRIYSNLRLEDYFITIEEFRLGKLEKLGI